jgi:hypothetical protein
MPREARRLNARRAWGRIPRSSIGEFDQILCGFAVVLEKSDEAFQACRRDNEIF